MRAEVFTEFVGLPPGEKRNKRFQPGDIIEGELARVAVENGFAFEIEGEDDAPAGKSVAMTRPLAASPQSLGEKAKAKSAKAGRKTAADEPDERRGEGPFDDGQDPAA